MWRDAIPTELRAVDALDLPIERDGDGEPSHAALGEKPARLGEHVAWHESPRWWRHRQTRRPGEPCRDAAGRHPPWRHLRRLTMRLLSYNIHKGIGGRDRRYRLERIVQVIEAENADFICLQEVARHAARTRHDDQPHRLIEALAVSHHLYQLNVRFRTGGYGNLILSRWPFQERLPDLAAPQAAQAARAQLAVVETPEGLVHLVHWHLGLAERERHWQATAPARAFAVPRIGASADLDRGRLQRLAEHPGPRGARERTGSRR